MICTVDATAPNRADVTLGGVITTSRFLAVVLKSSASLPRPMLSQAGARRQDGR